MEKKSIIRIIKPIFNGNPKSLYCPSLIFCTLYEANIIKNILPKTIRSTIITLKNIEDLNRKRLRKKFEIKIDSKFGDNIISNRNIVERITNLSKEIRLELIAENYFNLEEILKILLRKNGLDQEFICVEFFSCFPIETITKIDIFSTMTENKYYGYLKII